MCPKLRLPSVVTKTKPVPNENHRSFLASLILASIIPMSCDKILAFNYLRFPRPLMRGSCRLLRPLQQQIASRLPLQTNRSAQRRRFLIYVTRCGHILWLKGRRVRLIFGDGWYLWQVILEGGSPLLHRSPPLPCLMDITRCPRRNLQFWFSPKQTSPDVKA